MSYEIKKSKAGGISGYRVQNKETKRYYSDKALPYDKALNQLKKIESNKLHDYSKGTSRVRGKGLYDHIPALIEPTEMVIPTKYANKVRNFLKSQKIKIPS